MPAATDIRNAIGAALRAAADPDKRRNSRRT